jgi:hypothetical protein
MPLPAWYQEGLRPERITLARNLILGCVKAAGQSPGPGVGIKAGGIQDLRLYHNVIAHCEETALQLFHNDGVEIRNNILYESGNPRRAELWEMSDAGTDFSKLLVGVNLFHNRHGARLAYRQGREYVFADLAAFQAKTGQAAGALDRDPLFVRPGQRPADSDYHLRPDSPALDRGEVIRDINEDFSGTAPDLGRYERRGNGPAA